MIIFFYSFVATLLQALRNTTKMMAHHSTPLSTDGIDIATWKVRLDKTKKVTKIR